MQRITATLINMYQWEPTLFDELQLPAAVNKDDYITRLLIDSGEQEVVITHPVIMKKAIGAWSRGKLPAWNKILNIESLEYNPIWNVDGETVHTGSRTGNVGENKSGETSETTTGQLSADNSSEWSNDTKSTTEGSYEDNRQLNETGTDNWTEKRTGNIGVTTTQKMMNEEKDFWESWDPIGYLIREFTKEFCLLVF